jgi:2-polyprenyl-3-methyl-5-hydroxy-6-metoxy-1,4-benzoquinol methylase
LFTNPRPTQNEIINYYKSDSYLSHSRGKASLFSFLYNLVRDYSVKQKIKLLAKYTEQGHYLDIGCGIGLVLKEARKEGWEISGVEPADEARIEAEKNTGAKIYPSLNKVEKIKFNAITMFHVLEHVHDLNDTMKLVRKRLHKEGVLLIALPNHESWDAKNYSETWAAWDVPRHLYHFSPYTAEKLFKKHKFHVQEILPMKFDSFYVSLLSERYQSNKLAYWQAFWNGLKSNQMASKNHYNYSSLIYVLRKHEK